MHPGWIINITEDINFTYNLDVDIISEALQLDTTLMISLTMSGVNKNINVSL